ncbi:MAG: cytochrome P450, partial [Cyanobacteria bacterium P01_A01_bin.84]
MKQLSDYNFLSPEVLKCPYEFYKLAREDSPVMELPSELVGSKLFLVTSYDLVKEILLNVEVFSSQFSHLMGGKEAQSPEVEEIAARGWSPVNTLLTADPPEHKRFRSLVNQAFTTSRVNKMEGHIKLTVDELIDSFIDKGECEFVNSFAVPLSIKVIAKQLGVPAQDLEKFKKWSDASVAGLGRTLSKEQEIECASDVLALQHYLNEKIEECKKQPGDDIITDLVQAKVEGTRSLDTAELISIIQQLLVAGNETITS